MASNTLQTFRGECDSFIAQHKNTPYADLGGLAWGLLRAAMECPHCPGSYRAPVAVPGYEGRDIIACPTCKNLWWAEAQGKDTH